MIYLVLAILFGSLFSVVFKICQQKEIDCSQVILFNYVTGALISWVPILVGILSPGGLSASDYALGSYPLFCALVQGFLFMAGFVVMDRCVWRAGVALTTVSSKASLVLSVVLSWLVLGQDRPKLLPVALVMVSILMIVLPAENTAHPGVQLTDKTDATRKKLTMLLLAGVFCLYGFSDFFLKVSQNSVSSGTPEEQEVRLGALMGFIFIAASLFSLLWCFVSGSFRKHPLGIRSIAGGLVLGLVNTLCTSSMLHALAAIPTGIYYPSYNIGVVIVSSVVGVFLFKEHLKKVQIAGIACAVGAILLFFVL